MKGCKSTTPIDYRVHASVYNRTQSTAAISNDGENTGLGIKTTLLLRAPRLPPVGRTASIRRRYDLVQ